MFTAMRNASQCGIIILLGFALIGCSRSQTGKTQPNANVNGLWKFRLGDWQESNFFAKLTLIEEGGIVSGTYTWKPYKSTEEEWTVTVHGMRVGKEVELHWNLTGPLGEAITFHLNTASRAH